MKLLIVDDDVYTREGLAENIPWELYGIEEVMQAENGKEALHTVSWYLPDLIITDIRMPQKNGIDFCKEAIRLVPECKIIFITGYMQTKYLKDAIDLSAVAFIEKPIQPEAVLEALEKAVEKIRRQQETVQLQKKIFPIRRQDFYICCSRKIHRRNSWKKSAGIADLYVPEMRIICAWKFDLRMKLHSWSHAGRYWRNILVTVPTFYYWIRCRSWRPLLRCLHVRQNGSRRFDVNYICL